MNLELLHNIVYLNAKEALFEDLSFKQDLTALIVEPKQLFHAKIINRVPFILCGIPWVTEVFRLIDSTITIKWNFKEGEQISNLNQEICIIHGNARNILTAERTALNFLQLLSGVATKTHEYVSLVANTTVKIRDTRKTIPTLRYAEKYAVRVGGGANHRFGLYDAILIKKNHLIADFGIKNALIKLKEQINNNIEIQLEVETLEELKIALEHNIKSILLDNMTESEVKECVLFNKKQAYLECSGGITKENILNYANTGVDSIAIGTLTKDITAIDLAMRFF